MIVYNAVITNTILLGIDLTAIRPRDDH